MSITPTSLMDVIVRSRSIGQAGVDIDLGSTAGHLSVEVEHRTDRYVKLRIRWRQPWDGAWLWIGHAVLDSATGELLPPEFDAHSEEARRKSRQRLA